jgi:glycosyltransferase involved in cell wall biosynthesis
MSPLIVMLQGMGNSERSWARLVSRFARVVLIQQGHIEHVEVWEDEQCSYRGPERTLARTRFWYDITFGLPIMWRCIGSTLRATRGARIDLVIGANHSMGLPGLVLRTLGKARKTVCFITDFMPIRGSWATRLHRRISTALLRLVARRADEVWAVSSRIPTAKVNPRWAVVPIPLDERPVSPAPAPAGAPGETGSRDEIGYIGFPTPDHALDVLFDVCKRHSFRLNIIGESPYLESIRHLAPPGTVYHGILNDEDRVHEILARCFCGYAVYRRTGPEGYSYYGIPSKTFYCFASTTPVVITDTAEFTQTIAKKGVGRVVEPVPDQIEQAILQLKRDYPAYAEAIRRFRAEWNARSDQFHRARLGQLFSA